MLESAYSTYWNIQVQCRGQQAAGTKILTVSQCLQQLGALVDNYRLPKAFRAKVDTLRQEIIYHGKPKTVKAKFTHPVHSIIKLS